MTSDVTATPLSYARGKARRKIFKYQIPTVWNISFSKGILDDGKASIDVFVPTHRSSHKARGGHTSVVPEQSMDSSTLRDVITVWKGMLASHAEEILAWEVAVRLVLKRYISEQLESICRGSVFLQGVRSHTNRRQFLNDFEHFYGSVRKFEIPFGDLISKVMQQYQATASAHLTWLLDDRDPVRAVGNFLTTLDCLEFTDKSTCIFEVHFLRVTARCSSSLDLTVALSWRPVIPDFPNFNDTVIEDSDCLLCPRLIIPEPAANLKSFPTDIQYHVESEDLAFEWDRQHLLWWAHVPTTAQRLSYLGEWSILESGPQTHLSRIGVTTISVTHFPGGIRFERNIRSRLTVTFVPPQLVTDSMKETQLSKPEAATPSEEESDCPLWYTRPEHRHWPRNSEFKTPTRQRLPGAARIERKQMPWDGPRRQPSTRQVRYLVDKTKYRHKSLASTNSGEQKRGFSWQRDSSETEEVEQKPTLREMSLNEPRIYGASESNTYRNYGNVVRDTSSTDYVYHATSEFVQDARSMQPKVHRTYEKADRDRQTQRQSLLRATAPEMVLLPRPITVRSMAYGSFDCSNLQTSEMPGTLRMQEAATQVRLSQARGSTESERRWNSFNRETFGSSARQILHRSSSPSQYAIATANMVVSDMYDGKPISPKSYLKRRAEGHDRYSVSSTASEISKQIENVPSMLRRSHGCKALRDAAVVGANCDMRYHGTEASDGPFRGGTARVGRERFDSPLKVRAGINVKGLSSPAKRFRQSSSSVVHNVPSTPQKQGLALNRIDKRGREPSPPRSPSEEHAGRCSLVSVTDSVDDLHVAPTRKQRPQNIGKPAASTVMRRARVELTANGAVSQNAAQAPTQIELEEQFPLELEDPLVARRLQTMREKRGEKFPNHGLEASRDICSGKLGIEPMRAADTNAELAVNSANRLMRPGIPINWRSTEDKDRHSAPFENGSKSIFEDYSSESTSSEDYQQDPHTALDTDIQRNSNWTPLSLTHVTHTSHNMSSQNMTCCTCGSRHVTSQSAAAERRLRKEKRRADRLQAKYQINFFDALMEKAKAEEQKRKGEKKEETEEAKEERLAMEAIFLCSAEEDEEAFDEE